MSNRVFLIIAAILALAMSAEAFAPSSPAFFSRPAVAAPSTSLFACRVNAKKQKRQRNRENMRKFSTPGRKGLTKRKLLKKAQATKARQLEAEFIAKCFITDVGAGEPSKE